MADSSKDIQLRELKDMIHDLQKMIKTLQATVDAANKREEALTQERDNLKEEVDLLRKKLFGTSSEKRVLDIPGQLNFFNEAELEQDPALAQVEELEASSSEKTPFLYTFPFMIRTLMFFLLSVVCYLSYQSSAATNSVIFRLMSGCDVRRDTGKSEVASPYAALRTTARCQFLKHPRRIFLACEISLIPMVIQ